MDINLDDRFNECGRLIFVEDFSYKVTNSIKKPRFLSNFNVL